MSKQGLAIAYNIKKASQKKRMMAEGGEVPKTQQDPSIEQSHKTMEMSDKQKQFAHSIADAIMQRRQEKKMADGGMVYIEENGEEMFSTPYDEQNEDAVMKELYDDEQLESQPMDSNEHGHDIEMDKEDKIDAIRKRMKMR